MLVLFFVKECLTALIVSEVTIFNYISYKHIWWWKVVKGEKERTIIISGLYLYGIDAISVEEMKWKILFELFE